MESIRIVLFCVLVAMGYGIVHDQVTVRVCKEYFTIGHPPVFRTESPTLLGIGWGVVATWWVGLPLGVLLEMAARNGPWPKRTVRSLLRPVFILLAVMGGLALLAGSVGYLLASKGMIHLPEPLPSVVPPEKHHAFLADSFAHWASYLSGGVGGLVLVVLTIVGRYREAKRRSVDAEK